MRFLYIALAIAATKATTTSVPSSEVSEETVSRVGTTLVPQNAPLVAEVQVQAGDEEVQVQAGDQIRNVLPLSVILKDSMIRGALVAASAALARYLVLHPSAIPFASIFSELANTKLSDVENMALKEFIFQLLILARNFPFFPKFEKVSMKSAVKRLVAAIALALLFSPTLQSVNTFSMVPRLEIYQGIFESIFARAQNRMGIAQEDMAVAQEEMPVAEEEMPLAEEDIPIAQEVIPIAEEEMPIAEEEMPVAQEVIPIAEEDNHHQEVVVV